MDGRIKWMCWINVFQIYVDAPFCDPRWADVQEVQINELLHRKNPNRHTKRPE